MASIVITIFTFFMVSVHGQGVDSAFINTQCSSDQQCPEGFFCYDESQYCTRCLECSSYKRLISWRFCPKTPSDCGVCTSGYEEEILHDGNVRDMCIPSVSNSLSHTSVPEHFYERYLWAAGVTVLFLPIVFYAFCRKNWRRDRGAVHHGLSHEEPPPYRSMELATLTSTNSEERLEDHVLQVRHQKESLVQAVPFRQPDYAQPELLTFDNIQDGDSDHESSQEDRVVSNGNVDLHDDNTMPSDWTPTESADDNQLVNLEAEVASESEESCEPASKRHKSSNAAEEEQDPCNTQLHINLIINNHVTMHKPS